MKKEYRRINLFIVSLALLPVFLHLALFSSTVFKEANINFGKLDLFILILIIGYLFGLIFTIMYKEYFIRLLLIIYSLLFAIAGTELFLKFVPNIPAHYMPLKPMRITMHPLEGVMPGISGKTEFSVNKYGLRGPDMELRDAEIKILCLGGSTTECLYVTDRLSWPWRLQDRVSEELEKRVFVGNAAKSGDSTTDHIYTLQKYQLSAQFDWIIVLCGINDLGVFCRDNYKDNNVGPYYRRLKFLNYALDTYYRTILPRQVVQDPQGKWLEAMRAKRKLYLKKQSINKIPLRLDQGIFIYKENLKKIISICRERNQNIIMLTQPTMWHRELPLDLQGLLWEHVKNAAYTLEVLEELMAIYNQAMLDVCREEGVRCIDLASMLSLNYSIFYDDCHLNICGCGVVSEILTKEMVRIIKEQEKLNVSKR